MGKIYDCFVVTHKGSVVIFAGVITETVIITVPSQFLILRLLKRTSIEKKELTAMMEDTIETISEAPEHNEIKMKPREKEILNLIAKGYTNAQIASSLCLSPETIKWYKKKLFAMFDVSNSAELIKTATDKNLL